MQGTIHVTARENADQLVSLYHREPFMAIATHQVRGILDGHVCIQGVHIG